MTREGYIDITRQHLQSAHIAYCANLFVLLDIAYRNDHHLFPAGREDHNRVWLTRMVAQRDDRGHRDAERR